MYILRFGLERQRCRCRTFAAWSNQRLHVLQKKDSLGLEGPTESHAGFINKSDKLAVETRQI